MLAWKKAWSTSAAAQAAAAAAAARASSPRRLQYHWKYAQELHVMEGRGAWEVEMARRTSWMSADRRPRTSSFPASPLSQSMLLLTRGAKRSSISDGGGRTAPRSTKRNRSGQPFRLSSLESDSKPASHLFMKWKIPWDGKKVVTTMAAVGVSGVIPALVVWAVDIHGARMHRLVTFDELSVGFLGVLLLQGVLGTSVLMLCLRRFAPFPKELFSCDWRNPFGERHGWLAWAAIGTVCSFIAVFLVHILRNGELCPTQTVLLALLPCIGHSGFTTAMVLTAVGIVAPVYEEILFRGFLLASLTKWLPTYAAVLGSAGVFAAWHWSLSSFPQLFVVGSVMGFAYAKSGNLLTPIMIHSLWNSLAVLGLLCLQHQGVDIQKLFGSREAITPEGVDLQKLFGSGEAITPEGGDLEKLAWSAIDRPVNQPATGRPVNLSRQDE